MLKQNEKFMTLINLVTTCDSDTEAITSQKKENWIELNKGQQVIVNQYNTRTVNSNSDLLVIDTLWESEIELVVNELKDLGIEYFILTESSSGLMRILHQLRKLHCLMIDYKIVEYKNKYQTREKQGLVMTVIK